MGLIGPIEICNVLEADAGHEIVGELETIGIAVRMDGKIATGGVGISLRSEDPDLPGGRQVGNVDLQFASIRANE